MVLASPRITFVDPDSSGALCIKGALQRNLLAYVLIFMRFTDGTLRQSGLIDLRVWKQVLGTHGKISMDNPKSFSKL